ncbi:MAG: KH domain-containing protein [Eubacterium sp.]|nr:KH domain-containing protein [Eubacterium sp.]
MEFREFTGKTVDDALIEAATTLGIASSELEVEIVSKGTGGFLGIGAKPAVINARPKQEVSDDLDDILANAKKPSRSGKNPVKPAAPKKEEVKPETKSEEVKYAAPKKEEKTTEYQKPATESFNDSKEYSKDNNEDLDKEDLQPAEIDDSIIDETKEYIKKIFDAMELESTIEISLDKMTRTMNIDVEGPEMGIIIGKRGQTLDALQYLISLFVNKKSETYIRVKLDTENYRERRRETLENLAKNIAFKVKKSRRSFALEPMNPYERRIIHSTLQGDRYVTTKSEGEEPYRKVIVYPKKNGRQ